MQRHMGGSARAGCGKIVRAQAGPIAVTAGRA